MGLIRRPLSAGRRLFSVILGYTLKRVAGITGLTLFLAPGIVALLWWFAVPATTVLEGRGFVTPSDGVVPLPGDSLRHCSPPSASLTWSG
jgi:hypothetical protein